MTLHDLTKIYRSDIASKIWRVIYNRDSADVMCHVFTNGHVLLVEHVGVFDDDSYPLPGPRAQAVPPVVARVRELLDRTGKPIHREDITTFVGDATWRPTDCDTCEGAGGRPGRCGTCGHSHDCVCQLCEQGLVIPSSDVGFIETTDGSNGLALFSRNYIGMLLELMPAQDYFYAADALLFALTPRTSEAHRFFGGLAAPRREALGNEPRLRPQESR